MVLASLKKFFNRLIQRANICFKFFNVIQGPNLYFKIFIKKREREKERHLFERKCLFNCITIKFWIKELEMHKK